MNELVKTDASSEAICSILLITGLTKYCPFSGVLSTKSVVLVIGAALIFFPFRYRLKLVSADSVPNKRQLKYTCEVLVRMATNPRFSFSTFRCEYAEIVMINKKMENCNFILREWVRFLGVASLAGKVFLSCGWCGTIV
jgi:hypothetical protein